jgi:hypothetical protein
MRLTWLAVSGLVTVLMRSSSTVEASFLRDVAGHHAPTGDRQAVIEDALLAKAVPLNEYKAALAARGLQVEENPRYLQEEEVAEVGDDYFLSADYMYSFSGFSLKYAKCQPVQRFSEDAIKAGEYTPMVTDDIVILRLCPYRFCTGSRMFGCHYNYAEYAIDLSDYIKVMIRYKYDKMTQLCSWCDSCYARRKLEDEGANVEEGDDNVAEGEEAEYANVDDGTQSSYYYNDDAVSNESAACSNYQTHCTDSSGNSLCQADDDTYMNGMEYLNYLYCARITDEDNYSYYVRPRCNGYDQTIKMAVFYDSFCSQYAGNEVSLKNFNLGFQESAFSEFYDGNSCLDCSASVSLSDLVIYSTHILDIVKLTSLPNVFFSKNTEQPALL